MSRTITLDVPETVLAQLESEAKGQGMTAAEWIVRALTEQFTRPRIDELPPATRSTPAPTASPLTKSAKVPRAGEEQVELRVRFRRHFGELNTGDPCSANNEQIDADLAREYSNPPAGEI
ncbi:MAG: hypothetical protein ACLQU5_37360 [Isosphaeraceae bacterium]